MRPLIIGQAPARGNDGKPPFAGQSGARLARLAGVGDSGDVLPKYFQLINLLDNYPGKEGKGDAFDLALATEHARYWQQALLQPDVMPKQILLMGKKVRRAMGVNSQWEYLQWFRWGQHRMVIFPHPSGINRWWNDADNTLRAKKLLIRVLDGKA